MKKRIIGAIGTTDQAAARPAAAELRPKRSALWVLALCLLLGLSVAVSMALLGERLSRFSGRDPNVIDLLPPAGAAPAAQNAPDPSEPEASPANAGRAAAGSRSAPPRSVGATSYTAAPPTGSQGELQVTDAMQAWRSETHVDLFRASYDGTVNAQNGEKVVAPGTSNFYDFTVKNNGDFPLDYAVSLQVGPGSGQGSADPVPPLEWRLLAGDGAAITDWQNYTGRTGVVRQATLPVRKQDTYTVEWRWAFERGDGMDEADTGLGDLAAARPLGVTAAIYIHAEQSAGWDGARPGWDGARPGFAFGKIPQTGDAFRPALYGWLLAVSVCGLTILLVLRRNGSKDRDDDQK